MPCAATVEVGGMPGPRSPRVVELSAEMRAALERVTRRSTVAAGQARRARIVLLAADGIPLRQIAQQLGVDRHGVRTWVDRFRREGLDGLRDRPRPGRPRAFSP
jgi:DNA-directed RNA polymerase specialized sigma24 family protein